MDIVKSSFNTSTRLKNQLLSSSPRFPLKNKGRRKKALPFRVCRWGRQRHRLILAFRKNVQHKHNNRASVIKGGGAGRKRLESAALTHRTQTEESLFGPKIVVLPTKSAFYAPCPASILRETSGTFCIESIDVRVRPSVTGPVQSNKRRRESACALIINSLCKTDHQG